MSLDVVRLRADTPGASHHIHLNNAGAALMPTAVVQVMHDHLDLEAQLGGYEAADAVADQVEDAYAAVAELLGTTPGNVALMENATAAFNAALSAIDFKPGDVLLTTRNDYASNQIAFLALAERQGVEVVRAPDAREGGVDVDAAAAIIRRRRPRLVTASHVPTNSGLVQPVAALGRVCRELDVPFLVDACQSVGQLNLDMEELGCDFLSATARKFLRGPRGIGFLAVSDRALDRGWEPLFPDMRGADWISGDLYQPAPDARRFENWEFAYALVLGLGRAARYALDIGMDQIEPCVRALAHDLRTRLAALEGVRVLDHGEDLCGIVTIAFDRHAPEAVRDALRARGVHTSWMNEVSAVLDFQDKGVEAALRLSPHYYNTPPELADAVAALEDVLS